MNDRKPADPADLDYFDDVLDLVGNTPLLRLKRVTRGISAAVLAKLEFLNPGGSVKDRIGRGMIEQAERQGLLRPGGTIIEPTSGNTGTGLAMVAAGKGYRAIFVLPDKVSREKIDLLRAYGAEVVITPAAFPRDHPESYVGVARRLAREIPGAYMPDQYENPMNPQAHYTGTGPEIWHQTAGRITHLVASVGTGGTMTGTARYLKEQNPRIVTVGADPEGSAYSGDTPRGYKVEGIGGDSTDIGNLDLSVIDRFVRVSDRDSFLMTRQLARQEGILAGGSAGTAVFAALVVARNLPPDALVVVIVPDTGRGYLSKIYNDTWMRENGYLAPPPGERVIDVFAEKPAELHRLITVQARQTVGEAIEIMQRHGVSQLPVTDGGDTITGSVDERLLLDHVYRLPGEIDRAVGEIMQPPFPTVDINDAVDHVAGQLLGDVQALLIAQNGRPIGLVSRLDLLHHAVMAGKR